jgi:hypothetical protein
MPSIRSGSDVVYVDRIILFRDSDITLVGVVVLITVNNYMLLAIFGPNDLASFGPLGAHVSSFWAE